MTGNWESWCRLCAKENGNNINVFIKNENVNSISDAIKHYFSVSITETDIIPTKICDFCYGVVTELISFSVRCGEVQELFNEIQSNLNLDSFHINELRSKYCVTLNHPNHDYKFINRKKESDEHEINELPESYFFDENIDNLLKTESLQAEKDEDIFDMKLANEPEKSSPQKKRKRESAGSVSAAKQKIKIEDNEQELRKPTKSSDETVTNATINPNESNQEPMKTCEICNKSFSAKKYNFHRKRKHNLPKEIQSLNCNTCGKTFTRPDNLRRHEKFHLPPDQKEYFDCPQCDKKFADKTGVQLHIKAVHICEKTFICEECGKAFTFGYQLTQHKVVHSDSTPFQCPNCPKAFKTQSSLKKHIDSHADTKHICRICGCELNTRVTLRRHMVIHSDEKKYKCNFCQREFKRGKTLKNHLILHTGLKPYQCPFCDQTFANGSNCRNHQKNSHPVELAAKEQSGEKKICQNVPPLIHLKAANNAAINSFGIGENVN